MSHGLSFITDFHKNLWDKMNVLEKSLIEIAIDESKIPQEEYMKEFSLFKQLLRDNLLNHFKIEETIWPVLAEANKSLYLSISKLTDDHNLILRQFNTLERLKGYRESTSVLKELIAMILKHVDEENELMLKANPTKIQMRQMSLLAESVISQEQS